MFHQGVVNATRWSREMGQEMRALSRLAGAEASGGRTGLPLRPIADPRGRYEVGCPPDWDWLVSADGGRLILYARDLAAFAEVDVMARFALEDIDAYWEWVAGGADVEILHGSDQGFHGRLKLDGRGYEISAIWRPRDADGVLLIAGEPDGDDAVRRHLRRCLVEIRRSLRLL